MKQYLTQLVDEILQKIQEQPGAVPTETGIRKWLLHKGYAKTDIDAAMAMVQPRMQSLAHVVESGPGTIRHLSAYENFKLSKDAQAALVRLELYELLDPFEREMILERLDQFDGEIGMDELDYLVSWVVCSHRDVEHQQTVYNALEGKGNTLH